MAVTSFKKLFDMIGMPITKQERSLSGMDQKIKAAIDLQKQLGFTGKDVDAYIGSSTMDRARQAGPEMEQLAKNILEDDYLKKLRADVRYTRRGDSFSSLPPTEALDPLMQGVMDVESFGGNPTALQGAGNTLSNALSQLQNLSIMQASRVGKVAGATPLSSGALGQFQIMPNELLPLAVRAGLDPMKDKFSEENQRKMAEFLVLEEKRPDKSMGELLKDPSVPIEAAQRAGANIWAGLPSVGGKSAYSGLQGNAANMSEAEYRRLLQKSRQGLLGTMMP